MRPKQMIIQTPIPAISMDKACKSYGDGEKVLKNFTMTVPQGTIYSLLGASGCGKTTALSCIIGLLKLDSGDVFAFGEKPGSPQSGIPGPKLGYMPQGITLYMSLSIKETLQYFGKIYGMTQVEIICRMEFLRSFLNLPNSSRTLNTLSGGQQRRVSLAVCLLHEPSLLILDEPTVGVDPLLRESIWAYLCELVAKKQTTVIITTHYIEEARQSNTIGLMRNGCLITESSPQSLLQEHNTNLLEEIVIQLCKKDHKEQSNSKNETALSLHEISFYQNGTNQNFLTKKATQNSIVGLAFRGRANSVDLIEEQLARELSSNPTQVFPNFHERNAKYFKLAEEVNLKLCKIKAICRRKALNFWRDPIFFILLFILPSFNMFLISNLLGQEPKALRFGIVNPETNYDISQCKNQMKGCNVNMSCAYLNSLSDSIIHPVSMHSIQEAVENVENGNLWGYMAFPQNFSERLAYRVLVGNYADEDSIQPSEIQFRLDMSQYFAGRLLQKSFYQSYQTFSKEMLQDCNQNSFKADLPLNFREPIYGSFEGGYQTSIIPACLIVITFFLPFLTGSLATIGDRKEGTMVRSMVAGVTKSDYIISFCIIEGITISIQCLISYICLLFLMHGQIIGSHLAFVTLLFMIGTTGLCSSFLLSQFCKEEFECTIITVGFFLFNLPMSGLIWQLPMEGSNLFYRGISYCLPTSWGVSTARSILIRGWSLTHQQVWPTYIYLFGWILLTCILTLKFWKSS